MNASVRGEVALCAEPLATHMTPIRQVPGMNADVPGEGALMPEALATFSAAEGLDSIVSAAMLV